LCNVLDRIRCCGERGSQRSLNRSLNTIPFGVGGIICNNHTLEPFKEMDLDSQS